MINMDQRGDTRNEYDADENILEKVVPSWPAYIFCVPKDHFLKHPATSLLSARHDGGGTAILNVLKGFTIDNGFAINHAYSLPATDYIKSKVHTMKEVVQASPLHVDPC